ncbi:response regulator [Paenibacillus tuaregi]|uniref:response regulator n=1 Tax=Paenibacillus tuaregi TaxID=1816681 RepID=UPI000839A212|nr:response regulator transcription factor [Paenibacillus tuaregi]
MKKINILLVEDDPFWQKNLSRDLREEVDFEIVGVTASMDGVMDILHDHEIDVVLLDIHLAEGLEGLEIAKVIKENSRARVIMLTSLENEEIIIDAFTKGADNFIYKKSYKDIVSSIRDAYANRIALHADVSEVITSALAKERKLRVLTPIERELYDLNEKGMNRNQIAKYLYKSASTIKSQLRKIREKLAQGE